MTPETATAAPDVDVEPAPTVEMSPFAERIYRQKYALKDEQGNPIETWPQTAERVVKHVMGALEYGPNTEVYQKLVKLITERKFLPGGRYLYASGRGLHQTQNCMLYRAEDSREGWAGLMQKTGMALMTGAGVGVVYSDVRPKGQPIKKTGGEASGPLSLMEIVNEIGRRVMQGGSRRSAIWAGLHWWHPDVRDFIQIKNWDKRTREIKTVDFNFPARMELTNVSVILDDHFFEAYQTPGYRTTIETAWGPTEITHEMAHEVYWATTRQMVSTAEPGFSVDTGENAGENLRNACTEVTSYDDSDVCNLGSINLARIESLQEMREVVRLATLFLLAGTVYSDLPHDEVYETRERNRRLGLGIMGIHEWLLKRGKRYGADPELALWLDEYARSTDVAAFWADAHGLSRPIKTRAIAPTGTIGIIAETTTGIEPIFAIAFKRRNLEGGEKWVFEYVVDPTAHRLVEEHGVDPDKLEDAYTLAYDVERRVAFQAWVQQWVDHGISSTINLPYALDGKTPESEAEIQWFGKMLLRYLPGLRGITCYPDGSRGGQPLEVAPYELAVAQRGVVFEETEEKCVGGVCGS